MSGYEHKSSVDQIRARFDADVERFSNLETGQVAAMDSLEHMALVAEAGAVVQPDARAILDIGCGAGNYTLKLLQHLPSLAVTLVDLSRPMLDRAVQRIAEVNDEPVQTIQGDIREVDLGEQRFDIVLAAQCLHHLRADAEWEAVFAKIYRSLRPAGSFWIADSVSHEHDAVHDTMCRQWDRYLIEQKGEAYRDQVMAYVEAEDTPRPLGYQMELMRRVGFAHVDVLLKRSRFASFGGVKPGD